MKQALEVTGDDMQELQGEKLSPIEKRNILVKQVIKPLFKKYGFSAKGSNWYREIEDAYIIVHLMNSQFNDARLGVRFRFHISASKKDEIRDTLSNQLIHNSFHNELSQFAFLPYGGMMSPFYAGDMYRIDGYGKDTPVEGICKRIGEDFEQYILPELCAIQSYEDFMEMRGRKKKRYEEKEIKVFQYYYAVQTAGVTRWCGDPSRPFREMMDLRKKLGLSAEDILSHLEWLDICRENSYYPDFDARGLVEELARQASKEEAGFFV